MPAAVRWLVAVLTHKEDGVAKASGLELAAAAKPRARLRGGLGGGLCWCTLGRACGAAACADAWDPQGSEVSPHASSSSSGWPQSQAASSSASASGVRAPSLAALLPSSESVLGEAGGLWGSGAAASNGDAGVVGGAVLEPSRMAAPAGDERPDVRGGRNADARAEGELALLRRGEQSRGAEPEGGRAGAGWAGTTGKVPAGNAASITAATAGAGWACA